MNYHKQSSSWTIINYHKLISYHKLSLQHKDRNVRWRECRAKQTRRCKTRKNGVLTVKGLPARVEYSAHHGHVVHTWRFGAMVTLVTWRALTMGPCRIKYLKRVHSHYADNVTLARTKPHIMYLPGFIRHRERQVVATGIYQNTCRDLSDSGISQ